MSTNLVVAARSRSVVAIVAAGLFLAGDTAPAQNQPSGGSTSASKPTAGGETSGAKEVAGRDYRIGPGDLLNIGVFGVADLSHVVRVSNSGKVHLTQLGILRVAGRTVTELESDIAARLREKQLVLDPWVIVKVTEVRAHPVYVLGEVMTPGQFQISDEMYLSDLMTLSNGLNQVASPVAYLYRRKVNPATGEFDPTQDPDTDEMEGMPIDLRALQTGEMPELNLKLRGGDILYVPERRKEYFFVIGDVHNPGLFELVAGQSPLRLSQAMARAGGPTRTAKKSRLLLVRYAHDGSRQEIPIDFDAVMHGQRPDPSIEFGDVIFMPGSRSKTVGLAMMGIIPGVVQGRATQTGAR